LLFRKKKNKVVYLRKYGFKVNYFTKQVFNIINVILLKGIYFYIQHLLFFENTLLKIKSNKLNLSYIKLSYYKGELFSLVKCFKEILYYNFNNKVLLIYLNYINLLVYMLIYINRILMAKVKFKIYKLKYSYFNLRKIVSLKPDFNYFVEYLYFIFEKRLVNFTCINNTLIKLKLSDILKMCLFSNKLIIYYFFFLILKKK